MSHSKQSKKQTRRRYSAEYKHEALALAGRIGIAPAARQLGLSETQLYNWRAKSREQAGQSDREQQALAENARLKRELANKDEELAILKKAAAYFAKESG